MERATGFEPATLGSEGRCSASELRPLRWSGRPDLNRGPRDPNSRALTKLRYAPIKCAKLIIPHPSQTGLDSFCEFLMEVIGAALLSRSAHREMRPPKNDQRNWGKFCP